VKGLLGFGVGFRFSGFGVFCFFIVFDCLTILGSLRGLHNGGGPFFGFVLPGFGTAVAATASDAEQNRQISKHKKSRPETFSGLILNKVELGLLFFLLGGFRLLGGIATATNKGNRENANEQGEQNTLHREHS